MDERNNKPVPQLIEVEPMQDGYRWVAITAMLLAIGIILHTVSPNVGGVTPNWTIAMYSIVINLTRPKLSQAIGIGFIAGLTLVPSSKSAFPLGNVASENRYQRMEAASVYHRLCCYHDQRWPVYLYSEAHFRLAAARMDLCYAAGCCDCRPA